MRLLLRASYIASLDFTRGLLSLFQTIALPGPLTHNRHLGLGNTCRAARTRVMRDTFVRLPRNPRTPRLRTYLRAGKREIDGILPR